MILLSELFAGQRRCREGFPQFEKTFDVIVCGLGTAGSLAAQFSAENGLSVLGVESFTFVGGTHGVGGVNGNYFGCPGGRYEEMEQAVKDSRITCTFGQSRAFLGEQALRKQGVEILYEASVCGVYLEGSTVIGLRVLTGDGIREYGARLVMDCTAEAFVAAMAGCATEFGRETDGQAQPYTLVTTIYDGTKYRSTNIDYGRVDPQDPKDLARAILFARGYQMEEGHKGHIRIAQMPLLGVREGRRILPEETVRLAELFSDRQTETPAFYSYADLDKHGWDIAFDGEVMGDWAVGANLIAYNVTVAVPYRAILPKGFDGILVPCRALGVDRDISSCVRMNLDMKKVAEVAAEWATLAIRQGKKLREVPYAELREILTRSGCLKESDNRGYRIDGVKKQDGTPVIPGPVYWLEDPAELEAALKTDSPGEAIWSAKRMGEKAVPVLRALLNSGDENTKKHAAFALSILGDGAGIPLLREMAVGRDPYMLQDCRKHNNIRACIAIYWLGRLADREITPELIRLICDGREKEREIYHRQDLQTTRYEVFDFEGVYFQLVSHAVMALSRIGDQHADLRPRIGEAFREAFGEDAFYDRFTSKPPQSSEGNMVLSIRKIAFSAIGRWNGSK